MKRKDEERKEARRLRGEGKSVKEISRILGISSSSSSTWVKDVVLTDEQKVALDKRSACSAQMNRLWEVHSKNALEKRKGWQEEGRVMARKEDLNFVAGCMLYWAEGGKGKNGVEFANSDCNMVKLFWSFLRRHFSLNSDDVAVRFQCYTGNGLSVEQIEDFWLSNLCLPKTCLRKCYVNYKPTSSSGKAVGKIPYGTIRISVGRTDVVQKIFGAIKEIAGFDGDEWLT